MNLILHIGIEKTGSSSIQTFLFKNKKLLENIGYAYVHTADRTDHRNLAIAFMPHTESDGYTRVHKIEGEEVRHAFGERVKKDFANEVVLLRNRSIHTVIVSSEHLHSRLNSIFEIQKLGSFLLSIFDDVQIVAYVRNQCTKLPSHYSTRLKSGATLSFRKAFDEYLSGSFDFYDISFNHWVSTFGKNALSVQVFNRKSFYQGDLIQDFLNQTGIKLDQTRLTGLNSYVNSALSKNACAFLRFVNIILPKNSMKSIVIREWFIKKLNHIPGRSWSLTAQQSQQIKKKYQESNEALRKKFFPHKEILFDD